MKWAIRTALLLGTCLLLGTFWTMFRGPRMRHQPSYRPFEASMPPMPEGIVPVEPSAWKSPGSGSDSDLRNPLASNQANIERGKTYYGYYCAFCHGSTGTGNGPVGESYVPTPSRLRNGALDGYNDGQLMRRMLTGAGHEPVLEHVVHPGHRWYLVLYLRHLNAMPREETPRGDLQPQTMSPPR